MSTTMPLPALGRTAPAPRTRVDDLWPLAAAVVGYPVWWLLGLTSAAPILATLPMAVQLWRKRSQVRFPPAFGWWALFLVWVLISSTTLRADALGAVPGAGGLGRVAVYLYRLAWYVACTIVLLWAANLRRNLSFARVSSVVGWMFVFCVTGGLAGVLLSQVDFPSLLEVVLPDRVAQNSFVSSLVHPGLADVQYVLGYPEARPKAPFAFANTWGSVFSLSLPFFWVGWLVEGRRWQRVAAPFVLVAGAVPMILSLNRGLWISLVLGALILVARQARRGRSASLVAVLVVSVAVVLALVVSPLGTVIVERLNHGHSNERRSLLLQATVASASEGSPVIGFGSTRDVQGNFASIAGGSTADCSACGVPPLGTQGHIWLVIFSNGLVGAALFVLFFLLVLLRFVRCRDLPETVATVLLAFFAVQVFVYDTLGLPLLLVMLATGLASRAQRTTAGVLPGPTLRDSVGALRPAVPLVVVLGATGLLVGLVYAGLQPRTWTASSRVDVVPAPAVLGQPPERKAAARVTIDTESKLLLADDVLGPVVPPGESLAQVRQRVSVTAPANTSVLVVTVTSSSARDAEELADGIVQRYLAVRSSALEDRRDQTLRQLEARRAALAPLVLPSDAAGGATSGPPRTRRSRQVESELRTVGQAIQQVAVTPVSGGTVLGSTPAAEQGRELGKLGGSGLAVGVLAGLVVGSLRRRPADRAPRTRAAGSGREDGR